MTVVLTIARSQLLMLRNDPWFLVVMFAMPLAVMPLFATTMGLSLNASGFADADGAEQVVPGQTVLFGFFVANSAAFAVFREHGWKTWDRLRASAATSRQLLAGYALPWTFIHTVYQLALFAAGVAVLGLRFDGGSPVAVALVIVAYAACLNALMLLATATLRTVQQVGAVSNVGAMVLGGLGGALVPLEQLPGWARAVAPLTPPYWAMRGHRAVFLEAGGVVDVLGSVAVLLAAAAVFGGLAATRFRLDETKEFFA